MYCWGIGVIFQSILIVLCVCFDFVKVCPTVYVEGQAGCGRL